MTDNNNIVNISDKVEISDPMFIDDAAFYAIAVERRDSMIKFMDALGISRMQTHLINEQGQAYRLLIDRTTK